MSDIISINWMSDTYVLLQIFLGFVLGSGETIEKLLHHFTSCCKDRLSGAIEELGKIIHHYQAQANIESTLPRVHGCHDILKPDCWSWALVLFECCLSCNYSRWFSEPQLSLHINMWLVFKRMLHRSFSNTRFHFVHGFLICNYFFHED